jgi:mRNA interferase MazF
MAMLLKIQCTIIYKVARISTQTDNTTFDIPLIDWRSEGLLSASFVRLHKIATLNNTLIDRQLGALTQSDKERVAEQLKQIFDLRV